MWPDNEQAFGVFQRAGTKWVFPAMGGVPTGLRWEAIYPLMDRLGLDEEAWNDLHDALSIMESEATDTMREFAPKPKK